MNRPGTDWIFSEEPEEYPGDYDLDFRLLFRRFKTEVGILVVDGRLEPAYLPWSHNMRIPPYMRDAYQDPDIVPHRQHYMADLILPTNAYSGSIGLTMLGPYLYCLYETVPDHPYNLVCFKALFPAVDNKFKFRRLSPSELKRRWRIDKQILALRVLTSGKATL